MIKGNLARINEKLNLPQLAGKDCSADLSSGQQSLEEIKVLS
jgi:hypothetical protein